MLNMKSVQPGYEKYLLDQLAKLLEQRALGQENVIELDKLLDKIDDYYIPADAIEAVGSWHDPSGILKNFNIADRSIVEPEAFKSLVAGFNPLTGAAMFKECQSKNKETGEIENTHSGGTDTEFSPPKDFSALYAIASPEVRKKLDVILDRSVRDALDFLNNNATYTRIKKEIVPVKFAAALFAHGTNRNGDPHRHMHCMVMNYCEVNGKVQTIDNFHFFKYRKAADAIANATMMRLVAEEFPSLKVKPTEHSFEIENIPRSLITGWSSRQTQMIYALDRFKKERGIEGDLSKEDAAKIWEIIFYETRPDKTIEEVSALDQRWIDDAIKFQVGDLTATSLEAKETVRKLIDVSQALRDRTMTFDQVIEQNLLPKEIARKAVKGVLKEESAKQIVAAMLAERGYSNILAGKLINDHIDEEAARRLMMTPEKLASIINGPGIAPSDRLESDSPEARDILRGVIMKFLETESTFKDTELHEKAAKALFGKAVGADVAALIKDLKDGKYDLGECVAVEADKPVINLAKKEEMENVARRREQQQQHERDGSSLGSGDGHGRGEPRASGSERGGQLGSGFGYSFGGDLVSEAGSFGRPGHSGSISSLFGAGSFGEGISARLRRLREWGLGMVGRGENGVSLFVRSVQGTGTSGAVHRVLGEIHPGDRAMEKGLGAEAEGRHVAREKLEFIRNEKYIDTWSISSQKATELRLQSETARLANNKSHQIDMQYVDEVLAKVTKQKEHDALAALEEKYNVDHVEVLGPKSTASDDLKAVFQAAVDACQNSMSKEQAAAVRYSVEANDFRMVRGRAGVGKSFSLKVMREIFEHFGYDVRGMAIGHSQKIELIASTDIKSVAIAGFIKDYEDGKFVPNEKTVIVVDECGLIGSRTAAKLLDIAARHGCKIIMTGDEAQHQAVEAGPAMEIMMQAAGSCIISTLRRQRNAHEREFVADLAAGRSLSALANMDAHGQLVVCNNRDETISRMITDWGDYTAANPDKTALLLAVSNDDCRTMVDGVRKILRERQVIGERDYFVTCKKQGGNDETATIELPFAVGDRIVVRKNIKGDDIFNKNEATITDIKHSKAGSIEFHVKFDDGRQYTLDEDQYKDKKSGGMPIHHAYAVTSHSSQGMTRDVTFALTSFMDRYAAYVMCSRQRDKVMAYVDKDRIVSDILREDPGKRNVSHRDVVIQLAKQIFRGGNKTCTIDLEDSSLKKVSGAQKVKNMLEEGMSALMAATKSITRIKNNLVDKLAEAKPLFEADKAALAKFMEKIKGGEVAVDSSKLKPIEEYQQPERNDVSKSEEGQPGKPDQVKELEDHTLQQHSDAEVYDTSEITPDDIEAYEAENLRVAEEIEYERKYEHGIDDEEVDLEEEDDYDEEEEQGMTR